MIHFFGVQSIFGSQKMFAWNKILSPGRLIGNSWWNWWQHYEVQSSGLVQKSKIKKKPKLCQQKLYAVPEAQTSFLELLLSAPCQY